MVREGARAEFLFVMPHTVGPPPCCSAFGSGDGSQPGRVRSLGGALSAAMSRAAGNGLPDFMQVTHRAICLPTIHSDREDLMRRGRER